jgi:hypothetical protein
MESITKQILLYIPINEYLPEEIYTLTPQETILLIKTGYNTLISAKNSVNSLTNDEIYSNVRTEMKATIENLQEKITILEMDLKLKEESIEKQIGKRLSIQQENFEYIQSSQMKEREHMQNRIIELEKELHKQKDVEKEFTNKINQEAVKIIHHELESMKTILHEKDKQNEYYKHSFDKALEKIDILTQKKSVVSIGKQGEHQFKEIATSAFRDFDSFELADVHNIGGQGDFHLKFKDFTILADSKLYSNKVNSTSRDKIKRDLKKNDHIHFAWLVSLDTTIDKFDKAPFMFEWLTDNKCICYINSLLKYEEPGEMLRAVWYCCKILYGIMVNDESDNREINKLREQELKVREIAQKMVKNGRERETILSQLRGNFDRNDEYIRDILNNETNKLVDNYFGIVVEWWNSKIEETVSGESIKSTAIWTQFKRDNENIGDMDCNSFKDILCSFLKEDKYIKPKTKAGALEIKNIRWKSVTNEIVVAPPTKIKIKTKLANEVVDKR